jgi:hypothetical protein
MQKFQRGAVGSLLQLPTACELAPDLLESGVNLFRISWHVRLRTYVSKF